MSPPKIRKPMFGPNGRPTMEGRASELMRLRQIGRDYYERWAKEGRNGFTLENWRYRLLCIEDVTAEAIAAIDAEKNGSLDL